MLEAVPFWSGFFYCLPKLIAMDDGQPPKLGSWGLNRALFPSVQRRGIQVRRRTKTKSNMPCVNNRYYQYITGSILLFARFV